MYVCLSVGMCTMCMKVPVDSRGGMGEEESFGTGVKGSSELPSVGSGNLTEAYWKSSQVLLTAEPSLYAPKLAFSGGLKQ